MTLRRPPQWLISVRPTPLRPPSGRLTVAWFAMLAAVLGATAAMAAMGADGTGTVDARAASTPTVAVRNAWSRATAPGAPVGVAYFEIVNTGAGDELLGIESPAAARVEMHATTTVNGMMEMRATATVEIPAAGHVAFAPGGLHAMLMELKQPLVEGARIPLTLVFRHAGRVAVQAVVEGPGAMTAPPDAPTAGRARIGVPAAAAAAPPSATGAAYRLTVWPPHAATPGFALVDAAGRSRTLADYRGRVVVLFFGFVHCPDVCPAELFKLGLVMKQLGPAAAHVQVLFVTLDPDRDTREVLKSYVTAFDPGFVGLTGSTAQIERAAGSFFVDYARVPAGTDYTIDHSTSTFVVDRAGRLRLVGTATAGVGDYSHDLALLIAEQAPRG